MKKAEMPVRSRECAEDDEDHDVLGAHVDGGVHHAGGGVEQVINVLRALPNRST